MGKYKVTYFRCDECGLIETEHPYWLEEAYSDAIAEADVGLVGRNVNNSRITQHIISFLFDANSQYLDYGGGYGILTRLMRDAGFNFYCADKHCPNLFAKGFDADLSKRYELVTAFEVFEHLINPAETLLEMSTLSPNIFFTTYLIPFNQPLKVSEWWCYGLSSGQHISFYTIKSLSVLAARAKRNLYSRGPFHLISERRISPLFLVVLSNNRSGPIIDLLLTRRKSLLQEDYNRIVGHAAGAPAALR